MKYLYYIKSVFLIVSGFSNWPLVVMLFLGVSSFPKKVKLKSGQSFLVRCRMDLWTLKETFLDRFYEKYDCKIGSDQTIVDVGAAFGDYAIFAASKSSTNSVYAFEPFTQSREYLEENIRLNGLSNITVLPFALNDKEATLELDVSKREPGSFSTHSVASGAELLKVEAITLERAFETLSIRHCDILKIDCEGAEYSILMSAPFSLFDRIDKIVMEYHDFFTDKNHIDLAVFLTERGYKTTSVTNVVHNNIGYLYAVK